MMVMIGCGDDSNDIDATCREACEKLDDCRINFESSVEECIHDRCVIAKNSEEVKGISECIVDTPCKEIMEICY